MKNGLALVAAAAITISLASPAQAQQLYRHPQDVRVPSCKYRFADGYSGHKFSRREVAWTIKCSVRRWPVPGGTSEAMCIAKRESGLRAWAKNATSSASGVFQIVAGTWFGMRSHLHRVFVHQRMAHSVFNGRANVVAAIRTAHGSGWGPWGGGCN